MPVFTTSLQHCTEVQTKAIRQENEIKVTRNVKEEVNIPLYTDDNNLLCGKPEKYTTHTHSLQLINLANFQDTISTHKN